MIDTKSIIKYFPTPTNNILNEEIDDDKVKEFILHSYTLIYNSLPKKLRISLDLHI